MSTLSLSTARIVVHGWTYWQGQLDNRDEARAMLLDAFASELWPPAPVNIAVTPGGFIRARFPHEYDGARGWNSRKGDLCKLIPSAEAAIAAVVSGQVLKRAAERTNLLTLGVDLNVERHKEERIQEGHRCRESCPFTCTHAELVAVLDTASGKVVHWTGKSLPVDEQQHTLVHVKKLRTHLLDIGRERIVVLGCHDLNLFIDRGRKSKHGVTRKQKRRQRMQRLAHQFRPTMVLHHPHSTYSPRIWSAAWGATRSVLPTARVWLSGIAFCGNPEPKSAWEPWQTLHATRAATSTAGNGVLDIIVSGCGC